MTVTHNLIKNQHKDQVLISNYRLKIKDSWNDQIKINTNNTTLVADP